MPLLRSLMERPNLFDEIDRFRQEMDVLFDGWTSDGFATPVLASTYPAMNIWVDENNVYAETEIPGIDLNDMEISVTGEDQLTIKGNREQPALPKDTTCHRQERGFGSFIRVMTLPVRVAASKIEARLIQGVLTIMMPISEEAKPKLIPIKVG